MKNTNLILFFILVLTVMAMNPDLIDYEKDYEIEETKYQENKYLGVVLRTEIGLMVEFISVCGGYGNVDPENGFDLLLEIEGERCGLQIDESSRVVNSNCPEVEIVRMNTGRYLIDGVNNNSYAMVSAKGSCDE